jgi:hypothetical protein
MVGAKYSIFIKALNSAAAQKCGLQASSALATGAGSKDLITVYRPFSQLRNPINPGRMSEHSAGSVPVYHYRPQFA